jgi:hypothetical protein
LSLLISGSVSAFGLHSDCHGCDAPVPSVASSIELSSLTPLQRLVKNVEEEQTLCCVLVFEVHQTITVSSSPEVAYQCPAPNMTHTRPAKPHWASIHRAGDQLHWLQAEHAAGRRVLLRGAQLWHGRFMGIGLRGFPDNCALHTVIGVRFCHVQCLR